MNVVYEINITTLSITLGWVVSLVVGGGIFLRMKDRISDAEFAIAELKKMYEARIMQHDTTHRELTLQMQAVSAEVKMHRETSLVDFVHNNELMATEQRISKNLQDVKQDLNDAIRSVGDRFDQFVLAGLVEPRKRERA
jgi:uncharacterized protein YqgQ